MTAADELFEAIAAGLLPAVKDLLDREPALLKVRDAGGDAPIHAAARSGGAALVQFLLTRGADPAARDAEGKRPLDIARDERESSTATGASDAAVAYHEVITLLEAAG